MFTIKVSPSPGMESFQIDGKLDTEGGERMWVSIQNAVAEAKKFFAVKAETRMAFYTSDATRVLEIHPPHGKTITNLPAVNRALDIFAAQQKSLLESGVDRLMKEPSVAQWISKRKNPITRDELIAKTRIIECDLTKKDVPSFVLIYAVAPKVFSQYSRDFTVGPFVNGKLASNSILCSDDIDESIRNS